MSSKLVIVADLQHFKLFSVKTDPLGRESLEFLNGSDSIDMHQRLSEKVSDRKGNFQTDWGIHGSGEDHNIGLEDERHRLKEITERIAKALSQYPHDAWYFSAPKAINKKLIARLSPDILKTMEVNLLLDLTTIQTDELLGHFKQ